MLWLLEMLSTDIHDLVASILSTTFPIFRKGWLVKQKLSWMGELIIYGKTIEYDFLMVT